LQVKKKETTFNNIFIENEETNKANFGLVRNFGENQVQDENYLLFDAPKNVSVLKLFKFNLLANIIKI
jgi:hypothetical protein